MIRRLLRRLGPARATLLVTLASVALSLLLTVALNYATTGTPGDTGLLIAVVVPTLIAPLVGGLTIGLAYRLDLAEEHLRRLAITDDLTEAFNRRHFFEVAHKEYERARRYGGEFAVVIIDLDDFKQINDRHGHPAGDGVLRAVSDLCRAQSRLPDTFARYGGEEFVFLLPDTGIAAGTAFAERLRELVARAPFAYEGHPVHVTVSAGVSAYSPHDATLDALIVRADRALYAAKSKGKNQIEQL